MEWNLLKDDQMAALGALALAADMKALLPFLRRLDEPKNQKSRDQNEMGDRDQNAKQTDTKEDDERQAGSRQSF